MGKRLHSAVFTLFAVAMILVFSACDSGEKAPPVDEKIKGELAQQFMKELREDILPVREDDEALNSLGVLVSREERIEKSALLEEFYEAYPEGGDCSLTVAFVSSFDAFVFARLQFHDGAGYYFRYEYEEDEPIGVGFRQVGRVDFDLDGRQNKIVLKLSLGGKKLFDLTFRLA